MVAGCSVSREQGRGSAVMQFDVADGEGAVSEFAWSPDGRKIAVHSQVLRRVAVFDAASGQIIARLGNLAGGVENVAWDAQGRVICAPLRPGDAVTIWDSVHNTVSHLPGANGAAAGTAMNMLVRFWVDRASNRLIGAHQMPAQAGGGSALSVYDLGSGHLLRGKIPGSSIGAIVSGGANVAVVGQDSQVRLIHLESGQVVRTLPTRVVGFGMVAFNPDGSVLATTGDPPYVPGKVEPMNNMLSLWDTRTGALLGQIRAGSGEIRSLDFSPDPSKPWAVLGETGGSMEIVDWKRGGTLVETIPVGDKQIVVARFSPDGRGMGVLLTRQARFVTVPLDPTTAH